MTHNRLFILGIDGATFDLLDPWIKEGHLPHFARIAEKGVCQPLVTAIPPTSPVAWTSLVTGKNPGKHGITDWFRLPAGTYDNILLCGQDRQEPALWDLLSHQGKQVGVLNVPMTYPPEAVRGFMVSGIHTPDTATAYTYPRPLAEELKAACGTYIVDVISPHRAPTMEILGELDAMMESRQKALFYLLKRYPWDFFMAVFVFSDRLQHALWSTQDPNHPLYSPDKAQQWGGKILEYYQKMDAILGELLQELGENTNLLIVSDHGFGPCYKGVSLTKLLCRMGVLKINPPLLPRKKEVFSLLKKLPGIQTLKKSPWLQEIKGKIAHNTIDWSQSKAFPSISANGSIFINLQGLRPQGLVAKGREYEELREAIIKELKAFRDPVTGVPVFAEIYKKEEIYSGDHLEEAADLMILTHNMEYHFVDSPESPEDDNIITELQPGLEAVHRLEGIAMAYGPDIAAGQRLEPAHIYDITPTALYLSGLPVPQDMDGKIMTQIIDPSWLQKNPPQYTPPQIRKTAAGEKGKVYSEEELAKIREGLKGMGYLT